MPTRSTRALRPLCGALAALLVLAGTASAAPITVGSPLAGTPVTIGGAPNSGTVFNPALADPSALAYSPVTGTIVRWRIVGASEGTFRLRVLRRAVGGAYTAVGSTAAVAISNSGIETLPSALPIQAGDTIALDLSAGAKMTAFHTDPRSNVGYWTPALEEGLTAKPAAVETSAEYGFNADVQVPPTVTAVSPASGSIAGGTAVTFTGTDFAGVSSVSFGSVPATSVTVNSEGSLTAVAPPAAKPGWVEVRVTTIAGTSPVRVGDGFEYRACVVPRLKGFQLKAAKTKLKNASCALGRVTKRGGATAKTGHVAKQGPKPGRALAPGTKVNITLH